MPLPHTAVVVLSLLALWALPGRCASRREAIVNKYLDTEKAAGVAKVANGQLADPGQFPYASLLYDSDTMDWWTGASHYCGGTLILPWVILTAAHCTFDQYNRPRIPAYVRVGLTDAFDTTAATRKVAKIWRHPEYNHSTLANDVALLQLSKKVGHIMPVKMTRANTTVEMPPAANLTVIGFGGTEIFVLSTKLLFTNVSFVPFDECNAHYNASNQAFPMAIDSSMMCAGADPDSPSDACIGDSGGALLDEYGAQVGIVSFGEGVCGGKGQVGGYADVGALRPWINKTLQQIAKTLPTSTARAAMSSWISKHL